jgi:hypothetical protein
MKPFNRERFLLYMLAGIFTWQAALFTFGAVKCFGTGGREACPNLGDRYENTVGIMVATTLALLGAGAVANQRKPLTSDPVLPLPSSQEPVQSTAQRPVPESVPESVRGKGKGRNSGKGS